MSKGNSGRPIIMFESCMLQSILGALYRFCIQQWIKFQTFDPSLLLLLLVQTVPFSEIEDELRERDSAFVL